MDRKLCYLLMLIAVMTAMVMGATPTAKFPVKSYTGLPEPEPSDFPTDEGLPDRWQQLEIIKQIDYLNVKFPIDWDTVPISGKDIVWTRCKNDSSRLEDILVWECTRFDVPRDYEDPSAGRMLVAFIRLQGNFKNPEFLKNIVVSTGDIQDSGVEFMLSHGHIFRYYFGENYNVIGLDPRGVRHSSPDVDCFRGNRTARWHARAALSPAQDPSLIYDLYGQWGDYCGTTLKEDARYIGTPAVAKDILSFMQRLEAGNPHPIKVYPEDIKIDFFGIDHGAILGATFATLYPQHVNHMILDSPIDYYSSSIETSIKGYDEAFDRFFSKCVQVGRVNCVFWAPTVEELKARYETLVTKLKEDPFLVPHLNPGIDGPLYITDTVLLNIIGYWTLSGSSSFSKLAQLLYVLDSGEAKGATEMIPPLLNLPPCHKCAERDWEKLDEIFQGKWGPKFPNAITCADNFAMRRNLPLEAFEYQINVAKNLSRYHGEAAALAAEACRKWPFQPPPSQRFDGNYGANLSILFLGTTNDPLVPLRWTQDLVNKFPGSALLLQDTIGHGTFHQLAECTAKAVYKYISFNPGALQSPGKVCPPSWPDSLDRPPW